AGGAARAAAYGVIQRGLTVSLINRTLLHEEDLARQFPGRVVPAGGFDALREQLASADLLVNCTPLGMTGKPPLEVDLSSLKATAVVADVVYAPLETELLAKARQRGQRTVDGLGMLLQQAGFGFEKWFGARPKVTPELRALIEADLAAKS
ncbi:MAG TPA: shikimate dehydrogenase, partial [Casimicrobiaceae bacterium]|nr:shikimate dehydrogenase [Casimicrobiaceae bacterium]